MLLIADNNTVCYGDTVNSTRLVQLHFRTKHIMWRDMTMKTALNKITIRKQRIRKRNWIKFWYNASKRTKRQTTDILCSIINWERNLPSPDLTRRVVTEQVNWTSSSYDIFNDHCHFPQYIRYIEVVLEFWGSWKSSAPTKAAQRRQ